MELKFIASLDSSLSLDRAFADTLVEPLIGWLPFRLWSTSFF